jgi:apolipoprotein N-acyltransferase
MSNSDKRSAQLVIVTGFLVLYLLIDVKWLLYVSLIVGIGSIASSWIGNLIVKGWFGIAKILGWINTRILLFLVFYIFLFPMAILSRLFKKDSLQMRKGKRDSLFIVRNHEYTKKDLENIW